MNIGYNRAADPSRYGAVILAAGLSSRMKEFKPLLHVDGQTAIAGLAETVRSAGIQDIVVVTGYRRETLQEEIERLRLTESYNEGYEQGMFSSIQKGLATATEVFSGKEGLFLIPVDCPLITIRVLRELMTAADADTQDAPEHVLRPDAEPATGPVLSGAPERAAEDDAEHAPGGRFFVPTFEGKKGHPLLIPAGSIEEIVSYQGDGGLKAITDRHWDDMVRVPVPDEEILLDMDTPEGYEAIRKFVANGFQREKLSVLSGRKRIILVRHGQTQQHEEPMFIGQYDVPLSEEGRQQAKELGARIAELIEPDLAAERGWVEGISLGRQPLPAMERIYCSDLSRASETAQIIGEEIRRELTEYRTDVKPLQGLREMALGEWDGKSIRQIQESDPQGYARRGEDLFTYKTGNGSENFYDMQYRAVAALREILAEDYARNVIIVAHSGVIRALENNLKGLRVDDDWEPLEKGDLRVWVSQEP